jgi:thioesterase domain-containing protein
VFPVDSERYVVIHRRGKKPPLFWVQPGSVQTPVLQELDRDQPVYFLYRLTSESNQQPLSFEEIAVYHIETLRSLSPRGPYALVGYCICGAIVYEMASQLRAQGETLSALIMIDPADPASSRGALVQEPALFRLGFNATRVFFHLQKIKHYSTREKLAYGRKSLQVIRDRLKSRMNRQSPNARLHAHSQMAQSSVDVHASDIQAFANCVPQPYSGSATVLRPTIRPARAYRYPNLRWAQLITGGLEVQETPGDSDSMWVAPNAKGMANVIESCLARIPGVPLLTKAGGL